MIHMIGSGPGAEQAARLTGYELDAAPVQGTQYIAVLVGPDSLLTYDDLNHKGITPIALLAWCVPSAVLASLAPTSPPIIVGASSPAEIEAVIANGNDSAFISKLNHQARLEAYLAKSGA